MSSITTYRGAPIAVNSETGQFYIQNRSPKPGGGYKATPDHLKDLAAPTLVELKALLDKVTKKKFVRTKVWTESGYDFYSDRTSRTKYCHAVVTSSDHRGTRIHVGNNAATKSYGSLYLDSPANNKTITKIEELHQQKHQLDSQIEKLEKSLVAYKQGGDR